MPDQNPKRARPGEGFVPNRSNLQKQPEDWVTRDERMTDAQASYLKTLSEEASEEYQPDLSKAEASRRIDELQRKVGRGRRGQDS